MRTKRIEILDVNLDNLVNFVVDKVLFQYENHSSDMTVLINESYHLRTMSGQLDMVIFKMAEKSILVDIIAGGGREGILNMSLFSELQFVQSVESVLCKYASCENLELRDINTE